MKPILVDKTEVFGLVRIEQIYKKDSVTAKYDLYYLMYALEYLKLLKQRLGMKDVEIRMKQSYPIMFHLSDDVAFSVAPLLKDSDSE